MIDTFHGEDEGHFLYSRHSSPSNHMLEQSLASLEGTESAAVFGSGMGAITATLLQLCGQGDHIVASRTIYGGTFAFMKNFLPRVGVEVTFVNVQSLSEVEAALRPETRLIYCESMSNPLLRIADLNALAQKAEARNIPLVVDNTFTPLVIRPHLLGAQIVIHSLTKFINGNNDCLGGVVCSSQEFIDSLKDVNSGAAMLLGSTLDSIRSASLLKNLQTLGLRMRRHSRNALMLARSLESAGYTVSYPGLESHPDFEIIGRQHEEEYGFGGMLTLDAGSLEGADRLMQSLQEKGVGYLAVSLGFHKTLFSASGSSTSSEIPEDEQEMMGLTDGLVRFSVGLDEDMPGTVEMILESLRSCEIPNGTVHV
jgi:methionine-gamma-lyase